MFSEGNLSCVYCWTNQHALYSGTVMKRELMNEVFLRSLDVLTHMRNYFYIYVNEMNETLPHHFMHSFIDTSPQTSSVALQILSWGK